MLKTLTYARTEVSHRALIPELLSRLIGAEAAQKTILACEDKCRTVYDKSTDMLVDYVLNMPHESALVPRLIAAAEDKGEAEDVRRYASLFREKLLRTGVQLSSV